MNILLKNMIIIDPVQGFEKIGDIAVVDEKIVGVGEVSDFKADKLIDGGKRLCACPGLMDMHVHLRDPGYTYKEDINSGCNAAAAGGFTDIVCMPNTNPLTDNGEAVRYIIEKSKPTGVRVHPVGCITKGMKSQSLCDFDELKNAGAVAVSDDGRPVENAELMRQALEASNTNGLTVISHCEDLSIIDGGIINKGKVSKALGVKGMDRASEDSITAREIALAMATDSHIHIAHVSTKGSVQFIRDAKRYGYKVTAETCPHYFIYTDEKLLLRDADFRMNPPLRTDEDKQAVLDAVLDGTIDCIVTDHAPHSPEEKADFLKAPNGVVGLETSLAAVLTHLYHTGKASLSDIVRLMSVNPRKVLNMTPLTLEIGEAADITIFDPHSEWVVDPDKFKSKSKNSLFKGEKLIGKVINTISGGKFIFSNNG